MKAAFIETTGSHDVIRYGDLPRPTPGQGEVLVRVAAVAVNPIDTYIRSGMVAANLPRPFIIGCDLAGTVEAVGPGVRVWGSNQGVASPKSWRLSAGKCVQQFAASLAFATPAGTRPADPGLALPLVPARA